MIFKIINYFLKRKQEAAVCVDCNNTGVVYPNYHASGDHCENCEYGVDRLLSLLYNDTGHSE